MILLLEPNEDLFFRTEYAEWVRLVCKISNVSGNISVNKVNQKQANGSVFHAGCVGSLWFLFISLQLFC